MFAADVLISDFETFQTLDRSIPINPHFTGMASRPPECFGCLHQLRSDDYDKEKYDAYGLGMSILHLFAGEHPTTSRKTVAEDHASGKIRKEVLHLLNSAFPRRGDEYADAVVAVVEIVLKLTHPDHRTRSTVRQAYADWFGVAISEESSRPMTLLTTPTEAVSLDKSVAMTRTWNGGKNNTTTLMHVAQKLVLHQMFGNGHANVDERAAIAIAECILYMDDVSDDARACLADQGRVLDALTMLCE